MKKYQLQNYSIKYTRKIYNTSFHLRYTNLKYSILNTQKKHPVWNTQKISRTSNENLFYSWHRNFWKFITLSSHMVILHLHSCVHALLVWLPKIHLRLERWDIRDHISSLAEWKNHSSAVSFDVMLQDGNVRSYTTYETINNYSCISQYLLYIKESISEISVMKHLAVRESGKIRRSNESFPRQPIVNLLAILARLAHLTSSRYSQQTP